VTADWLRHVLKTIRLQSDPMILLSDRSQEKEIDERDLED
jgi:hypothetical protein